jgi:hypothetical protein
MVEHPNIRPASFAINKNAGAPCPGNSSWQHNLGIYGVGFATLIRNPPMPTGNGCYQIDVSAIRLLRGQGRV